MGEEDGQEEEGVIENYPPVPSPSAIATNEVALEAWEETSNYVPSAYRFSFYLNENFSFLSIIVFTKFVCSIHDHDSLFN